MIRAGAAVVAAGAALRIAVAVRLATSPAEWTGDARIYLRLAEAIARGEWIPQGWIWPPGFPLAGVSLAWAGGAGRGLLLTSLLAGIALPVLLLVAGRLAGRPRTGLVAATVVAFHPEAVLASARPLSESFALALVVATVVLAAQALPAGRARLAAAAGIVAGLAALTRPESLAASALLPALGLRGGRAPRRAVLAYVGLLVLTVAPYVIALHSASGIWALTLKPHWNLLKYDAYDSATDRYGDMREAWARAIDELRGDSGEPDPRRIAAAADPGSFLRSGDALHHWIGHARKSAERTPPLVLALGAFALAGLALPGSRRSAGLAAISAVPFLAVPVFVHPVGRFALPLLPAMAWGLGRWADLAIGFRPRIAIPAVTVLVVATAAGGAGSSWKHAGEAAWHERRTDAEAALAESRLREAERLLEPVLRDRRADPEVLALWARLRLAQGRPAEAEDAYRRAVERGGSPASLARLLAEQGRASEADAALAGYDADDGDFVHWATVANVKLLLRDYPAALAAVEKAERAGGPAGELAFTKGLAFARSGRPREARAAWERAVEVGSPAIAARATGALASLPREPPPAR